MYTHGRKSQNVLSEFNGITCVNTMVFIDDQSCCYAVPQLNKIFTLRKIRKFITFDAAVSIYKQMILPVIDYAGFLLSSCRIGDKGELQKLQNDILRICDCSRISDRISIEKLHKKCKSLSLEQHMWKQLGETSKFIGCSLHIQQPAAANLYRKSYT